MRTVKRSTTTIATFKNVQNVTVDSKQVLENIRIINAEMGGFWIEAGSLADVFFTRTVRN